MSVGYRINLPLRKALRYLKIEIARRQFGQASGSIHTHEDQDKYRADGDQRNESGFYDQQKTYAFAPR